MLKTSESQIRKVSVYLTDAEESNLGWLKALE